MIPTVMPVRHGIVIYPGGVEAKFNRTLVAQEPVFWIREGITYTLPQDRIERQKPGGLFCVIIEDDIRAYYENLGSTGDKGHIIPLVHRLTPSEVEQRMRRLGIDRQHIDVLPGVKC
jgi:hypothetical protein